MVHLEAPNAWVTDALAAVKKLRTHLAGAKVLLRADSAFYGHGGVGAAIRADAQVSVTVRLDPRVKAAIAATIRRKLVHVPARIASSARLLTLHLPTAWPWERPWTTLVTGLRAPPPAAVTT